MLDPLDFQNRPLIERLDRKRRLAALNLLTERLTFCLWRPAIWAMLFCGLWMFQIPSIFGQAAAIITAVVFTAGFLFFLYRGTRYFHWPNTQDIDRRIEHDSHVKHRPITSLQDRLANPLKTDTRSLWEKRKEKILAALPGLRVGTPQAFLAKNDPYALRLGVLLFFVIGIFVAGPGWNERIWDGLTPLQFQDGVKADHDINLWIAPPEYTGVAEMVLQGSGNTAKKLEIPEGSQLKIRIHGGIGEPHLHIDQRQWAMDYAGNDNYALDMIMPQGQSLKIKQLFMTRAAWNFELIPDHPPVIVLKEDALALPDGPVRFPLMIYDDYGAKTLTMAITPGEEIDEAPPLGKSVNETRSVMSPPATEFEVSPVYDLTAHPWAGLPAVFTFTVTDHKGQSTALLPVKMILPERSFRHPVAKALIAIRKDLIWSPLDDYAAMGQKLELLLSTPESFQGDIVTFLALRTSASRLYYADPSMETAEALVDLLWDTALRIEDGNLSLAARNLRDSQMALEKALQNPETSEQEISELMSTLRNSMAEYLNELQKEMQKRMAKGEKPPMIPPELLENMIDLEALSQFLDELEARMRSGDRNAAQEMLSQLQRMMDMMDPSMAAPMPADMQMMSEGVNELQELIDRQEELLAQTRNQMDLFDSLNNIHRDYGEILPLDEEILEGWGLDEMPPVPQKFTERPTLNTRDNAAEQEALRYILGQLMLDAAEALDEIPENMGLAEREMSNSSGALKKNLSGASIPHQEQAIEHLKESQKQLSQQLMARMQQMTGMMLSNGGMKYDPLGRPYDEDNPEDGRYQGSRVKIPDRGEQKKAQEILRLLRRRAGELDRPDVELEYYRRLLRQF